jgi:hypothetical protein
MHDHWHKEKYEMIANKKTLIWTWTCFAASCNGDDDSAISVGGGTLCVDTPRFVLCTSAPAKATHRIRTPRSATASPIQAGPPSHLKALVCENEPMWASCLDAPCTVYPNDPTKAKRKCPIATTTPWETLGGECDPAKCDQLWSAGHVVDKAFQEVLDAFAALGCRGRTIRIAVVSSPAR